MTKKQLDVVILGLIVVTGVHAAPALNVDFDGDGASLRTRNTAGSFHLAGYGYGDDLHKPGRAVVVQDANRIEYRRPKLTEWYVNGEKGLEQGFTFEKPI